jgi:hypothetical protein
MRIEPRFAYQVPVALLRSVEDAGTRQEVGCQLENLSITGLRISLKSGCHELAPGEKVYLTLTVKESASGQTGAGESVTVSLRAGVVWCREKQCGLYIESINEPDLLVYRELIENLKH